MELMNLPILPLRDVVVFPNMVLPLFVGRPESILALEIALEKGTLIFLVTQKDPARDNPNKRDLFKVGVTASILQLLRLPDGTVKVLVEGVERAELLKLQRRENVRYAQIECLNDDFTGCSDLETDVLAKNLLKQFEELIRANKKIPEEVLSSLEDIDDIGRLIDSIAAHMTIKVADRQLLLNEPNVRARLELVNQLLNAELELVEVEKRVQGRVKTQVEKNQKQYYLNEKIKAIQHELGQMDDNESFDELKKLEKLIESVGMSEEAKAKAKSEISKLKLMPPMSAEATVCRNYLDWLVNLPWQKKAKVNKDLVKAQEVLDGDHYGLEKVKERILENLAVQHRVSKLKGPIMCLVGPPGVGKTSLGQSIANATGRTFVRISLGGVRDEAEIRGHRRTYIGAMPGKLIQKIVKAKVKNPLIMLDEVDKMAMDFRGDPASALLEVLDPEQNSTFNDHYLEVDYDLSDVMFIATSNSMNIPGPLLDRMEVIRLSGYTETEKLHIAEKYLVPKQLKNAGLKPKEIKLSSGALLEAIRSYTREAGVRSLEREIAKMARKVVKEILLNKKLKSISITQRNLEKYLGIKKFRFGMADTENRVGQVTGLAWTEVGGEILTIEAQTMPGKGNALSTGSLGDVMQESIKAATTFVRSRSTTLGIADKYFQKHDFHVHVPEGATPKDGPSAGVGMCTALVSAITGIPVRADVAMTGEITLRGEVLPIGGLKEKLLAALRAGIKHVIIPDGNQRELKEIPKEVTDGLAIHPVKWADEVLEFALTGKPKPLKKDTAAVNPEQEAGEGVSTH